MKHSLRWKIAAGFLAVFAAGFMTGAFVGTWHCRHLFLRPHHGESFVQEMKKHFRSELHLTDEQTQVITPIIEQTAGRLEVIRTETGIRVSEAMSDAGRQIQEYLTPEQQTKLQAMKEKHQKMLREGRPHHHPPH